MNVLTTLGLVSTRSARSILKNIAELNTGNLSQSVVNDVKAQMTARHLTTLGVRESNRREPLNSWLSQLLFHNGNTENLQKIFHNEEISALRRLLVSTSLRQRKRAATIILCGKGFSFRAVASILSASRKTVTKYWHEYKEHGLDKTISYKSRRCKADDVALQKAVFTLLHSPPSSHGINRTTWTMKDLQNALRSQGSPACTPVIREIIKSAGYKWRKAKTVLTSNDPEYREKLAHIKSILSSLGENDRFFSIDEFGPFAVKMKGGRRLVAPDEYPYVPQFQTSKGCLIITAALELSRNQVTHFYSKKKDTTEMIKLLKLLLRRYKKCRRLYLSWDAASWHASNAFYEKVEEVNKRTYRKIHCTPIVKLAPLPASAQFLNVIESVFSGMARAIIHNSDYQSVEEAMAAIDRYFKERNEHFRKHPKKAGNKIWRKELVPSKFSEEQNCKDPRWRS
jgi:transposase